MQQGGGDNWKKRNGQNQEPITQSFHLPYWPSESTLSRIFLFLEAPPTGFFAGVYIIANHKTAVVLDCLRHAARKYFNNCEKRGTSACFRGKLKNPPSPTYLSSTNKKIRDRVDSRVQLVWRLWVIGSCQNLILQGCFLHQSQNNSGM